MVLRLDPRIPLVWRDPHTLQLGVDRRIVVLSDVTSETERLISALQRGVGDDGFDPLCDIIGPGRDAGRQLLETLGPALVLHTAPVIARIAVEGDGDSANLIRRILERRGHLVEHDDRPARTSADRDPVDVVVLVRHFALPRSDYGRWLRRDIPHLAVVFGDAEARIGPLVEPGEGPCLYCLDLAATDADPAWPAIASQLLGRQACGENSAAWADAAAVAARAVIERVENDGRTLADTIVHVDSVTGSRRRERVRLHPECACRALPGNVTALASRRANPTAPNSTPVGAVRG